MIFLLPLILRVLRLPLTFSQMSCWLTLIVDSLIFRTVRYCRPLDHREVLQAIKMAQLILAVAVVLQQMQHLHFCPHR